MDPNIHHKTYSRPKKVNPLVDHANIPCVPRPSIRANVLQDNEEEKKHFKRVVNSFKFYRSTMEKRNYVSKQMVSQLPEHQQQLLKTYKDSLTDMDRCIIHNQALIDEIIRDVENMFENTSRADVATIEVDPPSMVDVEKVQTTLKQFVRDWSIEGKEERDACYQPIINEIVNYFPLESCAVKDVKVLVPGVGLGRLGFEIARRGYTCQGNEFSLFMLIASNFVLNKCKKSHMFSVYPWIHQVDNVLSPQHQMRIITFPDVNPNEFLGSKKNLFTVLAGDFLDIYDVADEWDCVATCFFIDCANNIVDFIEKIYLLLKPGGIWVNLGPLFYHYSNLSDEFSIEPPYSTVREVITGIGFTMEKEELAVKTKYGQNPHSMLQYEYNSVFFVCKKPELMQV